MHIIPPETNESGVFADVVQRLATEYGELFRVVTYDSGANSRANARFELDLGRHPIEPAWSRPLLASAARTCSLAGPGRPFVAVQHRSFP